MKFEDIPIEKYCEKCEKDLLIINFHIYKSRYSFYVTKLCRSHHYKYMRDRIDKEKEKEYQKKYNKKYSKRNKEKISKYNKERYLKNKEKISKYNKEMYLKKHKTK